MFNKLFAKNDKSGEGQVDRIVKGMDKRVYSLTITRAKRTEPSVSQANAMCCPRPAVYVLVAGKSRDVIDEANDYLFTGGYKECTRDLDLSKQDESKLPQLLKDLSDDKVVLFCYVKGKMVDPELIEGFPDVVAGINARKAGQFMHAFKPLKRHWWKW